MSDQPEDRRSHPRIEKSVSGHILCHTVGQKVALTTKNISCSGMQCHVSHFIAPFTRLNLTLVLALRDGPKGHRETAVDIEGVIVRTYPDREEPGRDDYQIAVFFSDLSEEAREKIAEYVVEHDTDAVASADE